MTGLTDTTLHDDFLAALLAGDATRARFLIDRALGRGLSVADVYLQVLEPALVDVGELWHAGEIGVAHEHYATAIVQGIIGAIGPQMRSAPMSGRLAILACTPGERHAVGVTMIADFLEAEGWEVLQLGASLPAADLAGLVESEQPDAVGLSTSTTERLAGAEAMLSALEAADADPFVVVGGRAWRGLGEDTARSLGADARVLDPAGLARLLTERFPAERAEALDELEA